MQPVFKDGALGTIEPFSVERVETLLKHVNIDHVRVFNQDSGNNVGLDSIEEQNLKTKINALVDKRLDDKSSSLARKRKSRSVIRRSKKQNPRNSP